MEDIIFFEALDKKSHQSKEVDFFEKANDGFPVRLIVLNLVGYERIIIRKNLLQFGH